MKLLDEIQKLKTDRNAVILAHNYQIPAIQDVADFVGDSLGLSLQAQATDAETIVFCGVHFMAETAAVLCPDKTVLIPDLEAGCSLASTITAGQLRTWKEEHPGAVVVVYVNCSADVKAEADYCCTSANALRIVESIPVDREILFAPDMFLGEYIREKPSALFTSGWASAMCMPPSAQSTLTNNWPSTLKPNCSFIQSAAACLT